ncbi:MAG: hypothetical protein P1Q69_07080 [Candidatus Thorarchaeota archaeon]|nr:hypothetical protein [Candidatus Thorarchaeota archaeon]
MSYSRFILAEPETVRNFLTSSDKINSADHGGHGICWRISIDDDSSDVAMSSLNGQALSDVDVASLLSGKELFWGDKRYSLEVSFEPDVNTRGGMVFRESKYIVRQLGLKFVEPSSYLHMDSEKLIWRLIGTLERFTSNCVLA